jgi:hypothetical protein
MPSLVSRTISSLTFEWQSAGANTSYDLYWDNGLGRESVDTELANLSKLNYQLDNLETGSDYYFKIRAIGECGEGEFSQIARF